jgi:hypothetical protein
MFEARRDAMFNWAKLVETEARRPTVVVEFR